jgi:hypothetical protein
MLAAAMLLELLETQRAMLGLGLPFACATLVDENLVTRAHNALPAEFLASSASQLLFVEWSNKPAEP